MSFLSFGCSLGMCWVFPPGFSTTAFGSSEGCFSGNRNMSRCLFVKKHAPKPVILFVFWNQHCNIGCKMKRRKKHAFSIHGILPLFLEIDDNFPQFPHFSLVEFFATTQLSQFKAPGGFMGQNFVRWGHLGGEDLRVGGLVVGFPELPGWP